MRAVLMFFFLAIALCVTSCAGIPRYVNPQHHEPVTISVWVDQHAGLPLDLTLAGCNLWNEEDIRCVAAPNPLEADVVVVVDAHPCSPDKDGKVILAHADSASVIGVVVDCFYGPQGSQADMDHDEYRLVLGHEIGHELGIWEHVPLKCDGKDKPDGKNPAPKKMPDGTAVCGQALMNPTYDPDVKALTPMDHLAFQLRNHDYNVLPGSDKKSMPASASACTFTADKSLVSRFRH
jgi:hypothetical protein